jgi:hypothetical protein
VGAGRKPGAITKRTRAIAEKAAEAGITPLEVMLQAMRSAYESQGAAAAVQYAIAAAPYMHARLQAVAASVSPATSVDDMLAEIVGVNRVKADGRERPRIA